MMEPSRPHESLEGYSLLWTWIAGVAGNGFLWSRPFLKEDYDV